MTWHQAACSTLVQKYQKTFIRWYYNNKHGADKMLWHWDATLRLIGSGNDLMPVQHQPIIWTNADVLLIKAMWTNLAKYTDFHWITHDNVICKVVAICADLNAIGYFDGLVQDCSISSADALEIQQSCTKPLICLSPSVHPSSSYASIYPGSDLLWQFPSGGHGHSQTLPWCQTG